MIFNKDRLKELEYLRNRSICIIDFMLNRNNNDLTLLQYKQVIENTYNKKDFRSMKMLSRDTNAWAKGLPTKEFEKLEKLLNDKFGDNLSGDKSTHKVIRKLLKKGNINNEEEYRIIYEYLNDLSEKDLFFKNLSELKLLLNTYDK